MQLGVVGLGYVGLPLAVAFAEAGEQVVGVDVSTGRRVAELRAGRSYIEDVPHERLRGGRRPLRADDAAAAWRSPTRSSSASRRR